MDTDSVTETPRRFFYGLAILLLLLAVAATFVQKRYEGGVGTSAASRIATGAMETSESKSEVGGLIWKAECWEVVGVVAVSLALLSCGIAAWRREKHRWAWVWIVVLLSLYVGLELLMV